MVVLNIGNRDVWPNLSAGQKFMMDLLVSSLMTDGGLELSLEVAFKQELQVCYKIVIK